jgi:uncharacterized membrane protein YphA (DoxX/SURF4 family)
MSYFEKLSKQQVPLIYFVLLRIFTGLSWLLWSIWVLVGPTSSLSEAPAAVQLSYPYAILALLAGIFLILGLLTRLGAFLGVLITYLGFFNLVAIAPSFSALFFALPFLMFSCIVQLFWNTGRVLGLDKYVVPKIPFLAKIWLA